MSESFLKDRVVLHCGDCRDVLARLEENSIDSCVTDPPYHLTSIVKRFGKEGSAPAQFGSDGRYARASAGFMGKQWDGGDIAFRPELWAQVYRVLKPGAHLLAFGGTRTYHRMACAIEDAGFEIRDCVQWLYGSGFPKSHDVSKGIDRAAGAERETIGIQIKGSSPLPNNHNGHWSDGQIDGQFDITAPATPAARQWEGWGTALKPACELIVLARKPLSEKTVAANVLKHGVGAININGCRVRPWGQEDDIYCSCAAHADAFRKTGEPEIKESFATRRAAPISNGGQETTPDDTATTDIGCCDGLRTENISTSSSTDVSGKTSTDQSQMDMKFITSTDEKRTTASRICGLCGRPIISRYTNESTEVGNRSLPLGESKPSDRASDDDDLIHSGLKGNGREVARSIIGSTPIGRWPSNLIHDGSEEVVGAFPDSAGQLAAVSGNEPSAKTNNVYGQFDGRPATEPRGDSGSAARFFYTSKADTDDRLGSKHPTVKPLDLMQYLVRLITPPKGTCIDPFAGTGTTGEAAFREGMSAVLIEREAEYQDDIRRRMKLIMSGPDERARESVKQRMNGKPVDHGPLFDFYDANKDFSESINDCYRDIRERVASGGPGWGGWPE